MEAADHVAAPVDVRALDRSVADLNAASVRILELVNQLDDEGAWVRDGATSMMAWLAARYRTSRSTAQGVGARVSRAQGASCDQGGLCGGAPLLGSAEVPHPAGSPPLKRTRTGPSAAGQFES